jgi:cyclic dehypoxanthinyl futalosine synthase
MKSKGNLNWREILENISKGARLSDEETLSLFKDAPLLTLGRYGEQMSARKNPPGNIVTFIIDRNINYTNVCVSKCKFCAFYRDLKSPDAYVLDVETICGKVAKTLEYGGTQIMLQGGLHPFLGLEYYETLLKEIKKRFSVTIHSLSPAEIIHLAKKESLSLKETLKKLKNAGLDSLPGGGAEILDDDVRRQVSPDKITAKEWLTVMETAHNIDIATTATMVIGLGETFSQRINHFRAIRDLQERTGGFRAFIMWSFQPGNTELGGEKVTSWDYLRTLSLARLYLDNITHIQGSWVTQGEAVGQMTLSFGADDLGSIMLEENVVRAAGTSHKMSKDNMIALICAAGKTAAQRDTEYNIIKKGDVY